MDWSENDRAANENLTRGLLESVCDCPCPSVWCDHALALEDALRAARSSGRAEGERRAIERVAGVIRSKRAAWDAEMQREQQGRARWNNAARCRIAADDIDAAMAREFGPAWPAKEGA